MAPTQRLIIVSFVLLTADFQAFALPVEMIKAERRTPTPTTSPPATSPQTASTPTTFAPTTSPPTTPPNGCKYDGKWHKPGVDIMEGRSDNWCYGVFCDKSGEIVHWDNFNCNPTTPPTTSPPTTPSSTPPTTWPPTTTAQQADPKTVPITKDHGCFYEGKFYKKNTEIEKGKDGNWCYGVICDSEGDVVHWDNFKCYTATTPTFPPTTPRYTKPPTTTPDHTVPRGCHHDGKWYRPGSDISEGRRGNWCYGLYCDYEGNVIPWDNFSCSTPTPTTPPASTSAPTATKSTKRPLI